MAQTSLILLAAGSSNRLGQPKQLLPFKGKTLIEYMIETALASSCTEVLVVLGAHKDKIIPVIERSSVSVVHNKNWEEGMASSIRCGISFTTNPDGIIFMVCDQPFVSTSVLNDLAIKKQASGKKIIASAYKDTIGIPALFDHALIPDLMLLKGQEGAKKIIMQHAADVETIPFPLGYIDIDTKEDYGELGGEIKSS